jgi:hypothetical protein
MPQTVTWLRKGRGSLGDDVVPMAAQRGVVKDWRHAEGRLQAMTYRSLEPRRPSATRSRTPSPTANVTQATAMTSARHCAPLPPPPPAPRAAHLDTTATAASRPSVHPRPGCSRTRLRHGQPDGR